MRFIAGLILLITLMSGIEAKDKHVFYREDFNNLVTSLQLILRESTIQPKATEIDLRFTKPVLR